MSHVYNAFQMFLSLHQPMTKCQTPMSLDIFVVILIWKEKREPVSSSLFELWQQQKSLADVWCLVFSHQLIQRNRFKFPNRGRTKKFIAILCITLLSIDHIVWIYSYLFVRIFQKFLQTLLDSQVNNFQKVSLVLFLIYFCVKKKTGQIIFLYYR